MCHFPVNLLRLISSDIQKVRKYTHSVTIMTRSGRIRPLTFVKALMTSELPGSMTFDPSLSTTPLPAFSRVRLFPQMKV
jgi:hypothetical protein